MKSVTPESAIDAIAPGSRVVLPHGAVEPTALYDAFRRRPPHGLTLYSGLQFGSYPFLAEGLGEAFTYVTWQASPKLRELFRRGLVDFLPLRFGDVVRVVRRGGPVEPDVVVVQVSAPRDGRASLGISCSHTPHLIAAARLVIAEVHEDMPWTRGHAEVSLDDLDLLVESSLPLGTYRSPRQTPRDAAIVDRVLELVPDGAWVQLGVGAIPDAVQARLHEIPRVNLHSGMLSEGLLEFLAHAGGEARVFTGELAGSHDLYRAAAQDSRVELLPSSHTHDLRRLASLPRFVSINSAVEVDLQGQVNGETVDGVQISGVGGSLDFVEGTFYSEGGLSILALPSTTENGRISKIVARLTAAAPVTIPRHCADVVVTEYGAAHLRGRTLRQRGEALAAIAHPDFRDALARSLRDLFGPALPR